ncbi:MAG: hypothetical protein LBV13_03715 [Methanomassiliicoccaceae archaeon]|jgi:hypothetical protein|nr:hypothetical protein [Methanomassiliicoccaceae archaeon]
MSYPVSIISATETDEFFKRYSSLPFYSSKADIYGVSVKLYTTDRVIADTWADNFYSMSSNVRSHAKIICIVDPKEDMKVLYNVETRTAFLYNFDYYGWIKSIALAVASDILEDSHGVDHVHGAALDIGGCGVTLIAPSKTGKTTHSWGLLRTKDARLITDDWYFVRKENGLPLAIGSEKNCYIDADIGDVWEEFRPLVTATKFDNRGRGIANIRWVTGYGSVIPMTTIRHVIMLRRDPKESIVESLNARDAWAYIRDNDLCNPHQIIRDKRKMRIRENFFRKFFADSEINLVNTVRTPDETQKVIRDIVFK